MHRRKKWGGGGVSTKVIKSNLEVITRPLYKNLNLNDLIFSMLT